MIDIWRIRNPILKRYTFRKNHFSGFIQSGYIIFLSQTTYKKILEDTNILPSFCSDHSPLFVNYQTSNDFHLGKHFWKFNSSLRKDEEYVKQMKQHIQNVKHQFDPLFKEKPQVQWEFLKYEIRKFSIAFSKKKSKEKRENLALLEGK